MPSQDGKTDNPKESIDTSSDNNITWTDVVLSLSHIFIISAAGYYSQQLMQKLIWKFQQSSSTNSMDVDKTNLTGVDRLNSILNKRQQMTDGNDEKKNANESNIHLTSHESHIAEDIVDPDDIDCSFEDIGGMDELKQEMWELACLPVMRPDLFNQSKLVSQPPGILLYG